MKYKTHPKYTEITKEILLKAYQESNTVSEIIRKLDAPRQVIRILLKQYGIRNEEEKRFLSISKRDLEMMYYQNNCDIDILVQKLGFSEPTIRLNLKKYKIFEAAHYYQNDNFFSEYNEKSMYWAGFIAADGCIIDPPKSSQSQKLQIGLCTKDIFHLKKFLKDIESNRLIRSTIRYDDTTNAGIKYSSMATVTSQQICNDLLKNFNITPRKSLTLQFPEQIFNHPLVHHFIRGYMDGDGSIGRYEQNNHLCAKFALIGTKLFVEKCREILIREVGINKESKHIYPGKNCWKFDMGGNIVVIDILNYLYKDSTIYLDRKHQIYRDMLCQSFRTKSNLWFTVGHEKLEIENVKRLYNETKNISKVAKLVGRRYYAVKDLLVANGVGFLPKEPQKRIKKESVKKQITEKETLEKLLLEHKDISKIAEILGMKRYTVQEYLNEYGIKYLFKKELIHEHEYFSKNNESVKQFFWAGYLLWNCSINEKHHFRVTCSNFDEIQFFKTSGLTAAEIKNFPSQKAYAVNFTSDQIFQDLKLNFGITISKTENYSFSDELKNHSHIIHFLNGCLYRKLINEVKNVEISGTEVFVRSLYDLLISIGVKITSEIRQRYETFFRFNVKQDELLRVLKFNENKHLY